MNSKVFPRSEVDPVGAMLGTRYRRFETDLGIDGLAREDHPDKIEVLAVHSRKESSGQFREFVKLLKANYQTICIWHVVNSVLEDALERYEFKYEQTVDEFGVELRGWRWDKLKAK